MKKALRLATRCKKPIKKAISGLLSCVLFIISIMPFPITAANYKEPENNNEIHYTTTEKLVAKANNEGVITISGQIAGQTFSVSGKLYSIKDHSDDNIRYFVNNNPNISSSVVVINIEFELSAQIKNLQSFNEHLVNKDVFRIAAYIENRIYYAEQAFEIQDDIKNNTFSISPNEKEIYETIVANATWYTHIVEQTLEHSSSDDRMSSRANTSLPIYGDNLLQVDINVINKIGRQMFTREQFVYDTTDTGGYVLKSVEWPADSGNIVTSCLYYEITRTIPSSSGMFASIEMELVVDRQYLWVESTNTIQARFLGTNYRIYDPKLALACSGNGFDYICSQITSLYKLDENTNVLENTSVAIAKTVALQLDRFGVVEIVDTLLSAFNEEPNLAATNICTWPNDMEEHYQSIAHGKNINTMVRGIRVDTDGHVLQSEGEYLLLMAGIVDRDYAFSSETAVLNKTILYSLSYNLRVKNGTFFWLFGGDDCGEVSYEFSKNYAM